MLSPSDRSAVARAARCFHSLGGYATVFAVTALVGIRRLQDAFIEHVADVQQARGTRPGIAMLWVPEAHRGAFETVAAIRAACQDLEAENPSLEASLTVLWPREVDKDRDVAQAWAHIAGLRWSTRGLNREQVLHPPPATGPIPSRAWMTDVIGEVYEAIQDELGVKIGRAHGEFFTPYEIAAVAVGVINQANEPDKNAPNLGSKPVGIPNASSEPGKSTLDLCCGSARFLVETAVELIEKHGRSIQETTDGHPLGAGFCYVAPPPALLVGQDIAPHGPAMARISLTALGYCNCVLVVRDAFEGIATPREALAVIEERAPRMQALHARHIVDDALVAAAAQLVPPPPPPSVSQAVLGAFDEPVPTES
jgi:hypothetical protein